MGDRVQRQRYELKYRISERAAERIRDHVACHLEPDTFSAAAENLSYTVNSVYLDTGDLRLGQATINGDRNRFKLRMRYYSRAPNAPVFCEIKRRIDDVIFKQRGQVSRSCAVDLVIIPDS